MSQELSLTQIPQAVPWALTPDTDGDGVGDPSLKITIDNGEFDLVETTPGSLILTEPDGIVGTEFDDILKGTPDDDIIYGLAGNDEIKGDRADDLLNGGPGNNFLIGQEGDDILLGGLGDDELRGASGNDQLNGGKGNDTLKGGTGDDLLNGGAGDDILFGNQGSDVFLFGLDSGHDSFLDFDAGKKLTDVVDLSAWGFADTDAVIDAMSDDGVETVLTLDASNSITFANLLVGDFHANDFII